MSDATYWERVRGKAAELGTDGCTWATGAFADCCLRHDIEWRTGRTIDDEPVTFDEADTRFRACMFSRSKLGYFSPVAWWRYAAVHWLGRKFRPGSERHWVIELDSENVGGDDEADS